MKDSRLSWVLLLMLIAARRSLQYSCEGNSGCNCWNEPPDKYLMECPRNSTHSKFIVEVQPGLVARVRCDGMSTWSDHKIGPTTEVSEIKTIVIEQCPLPDANFRQTVEGIGFQPIGGLKFHSTQNLGSVLKRHYLSGFPELQELDLNHNGLTELPADLLQDLPELLSLSLGGNKVILPVEFFESVPKLWKLNLAENKLTLIDLLLFQSLKQLDHLSLGGNELSHLDERTFEYLTVLSVLKIDGNRLSTLPRGIFESLQNLKELDLSRNNFTSLPDDLLAQNINITVLIMNDNRGALKTLPNRFLSNLPNLEKVVLAGNKLEYIPEDILWGSSSLIHLDLKGNSFSSLPKYIFKYAKNLKTLDLSSNAITDLPDGIFKTLNKLEELVLCNNRLASIPWRFFEGLTDLKYLYLEHNGIKSIAAHSFDSLIELQVVRLPYNQLTLEDDWMSSQKTRRFSPFYKCKNLQELDLAHNDITQIFSDWKILPFLRKLNLKSNQISELEFDFLSPDIEIDITHNKLNKIQLSDAEQIATTKSPRNKRSVQISVEGNPLVYDCSLYDLLRYLEGKMDPSVQQMFKIIPGLLECSRPGSTDLVLVSELKSETLSCPYSKCPEKCTCWLRPHDETVAVNCSYRNLTTAPEKILAPESHKVELDLTGNFLTEVPFINQSGYGAITELLLSHNNICSIQIHSLSPTLQILELHENNLDIANIEMIECFGSLARLKKLTLHGNPGARGRHAENVNITGCYEIERDYWGGYRIRTYDVEKTESKTAFVKLNTSVIDLQLEPQHKYEITMVQGSVELYYMEISGFQKGPGEVRNMQLKFMSDKSAELQWEPPLHQNAAIVHYSVCLKRDKLLGCQDLGRPSPPEEDLLLNTTSTTTSFADLHPYAVYTATVIAYTSVPGSAKTITFQTQESNIPTSIVSNLRVDKDQHYLRWDKPVDCTTISGRTLGVKLFFTGISISTEDRADLTFPTYYSHFDLHRLSLAPYEWYKVRAHVIRSYDEPENMTHYQELIWQTLPTAPPAVKLLEVYDMDFDRNAVSLRWVPPFPANGEIESYHVTIKTENKPLKNWFIVVSDEALKCKQWENYVCFEGLILPSNVTANENEIEIHAMNKDVAAPGAGKTISFTSDSLYNREPGMPLNLTALVQESGKVTLTWAHPSITHTRLVEYRIRFDVLNGNEKGNDTPKLPVVVHYPVDHEDKEYTAEIKLRSGTNYRISVTAVNRRNLCSVDVQVEVSIPPSSVDIGAN